MGRPGRGKPQGRHCVTTATRPFPIERHVRPNGVPDLMFAAVHEAGHAVAARAFGVFGGRAGLKDTEDGVAGFAATAGEDTLPKIWARRGKFRTPEAAIRAMII